MKKLIAFIFICCFSFLLKNETASCKANCNISIFKSIERTIDREIDIPVPENPWIPYDGFFIKLKSHIKSTNKNQNQ